MQCVNRCLACCAACHPYLLPPRCLWQLGYLAARLDDWANKLLRTHIGSEFLRDEARATREEVSLLFCEACRPYLLPPRCLWQLGYSAAELDDWAKKLLLTHLLEHIVQPSAMSDLPVLSSRVYSSQQAVRSSHVLLSRPCALRWHRPSALPAVGPGLAPAPSCGAQTTTLCIDAARYTKW